MTYNNIISQVKDKALYLMNQYSDPISKVIRNSISKTYSLPEFESASILSDAIESNSNVIVLASWFSLTLLEVLNKSNKIKTITLLDHDKTVITVGQEISKLYTNLDITYKRKNVIFDDISEYVNHSNVVITPSINMLLPFNEFLPNLPKGTFISVTGTSNMVMKYGNPIYNIDDLKSQINYSNLLFSKQYDSTWGDGAFKFVTSTIVAKI